MARLLARPAGWLARAGCTADAITLAGFGVGLAAALAIGLGAPLAGLGLLAGNRLLDGLDGAVARRRGPTDRGAFLDITLDFLVYAAVPFGFACADPAGNAWAASALLMAFMGTAASFLAFAVLAERRGITSIAYAHKGLHYLGGLTEGTETMLCFAAMCLRPDWFAPLAWAFAGLCGITTAVRLVSGTIALEDAAAARQEKDSRS